MKPSLDASLEDKVIVSRWPLKEGVRDNWGDKLNPVLASELSGKRVYHKNDVLFPSDWPVHIMIGSSLRYVNPTDVVWGTGFMRESDTLKDIPRRICAVRGPLSRKKLLEQGVDCPEIYGDPALLYPLCYFPNVAKQYDIGIIQHFREIGVEEFPSVPKDIKIKIINIMGGIREVVDDIVSCGAIISSSLHGIIAAHAYGVPATWVKFSNRPLGDGFKFRDYWASMGWDQAEPMVAQPGASCETLIGHASPSNVRVNIKELLQACPFIGDERKKELCQKAERLGLLEVS